MNRGHMTERKPTADEIAGMEWWNGMSERERAAALQLAKANTAAEAWDWQKAMLANGEGIDVKAVHGKGNSAPLEETSWADERLRASVRKPSEPAR
jgi:hypothetical protein